VKRRSAPGQELKAAIDRLPLHTRLAMLDGIRAKRIIAGGNYDYRGGVCPMFAAHRRPSKRRGRAFARAWDRYAGAKWPRPATERELRMLQTMLEVSIENATAPAVDLAKAIEAHEATKARNRAAERDARPRPDTGERSRVGELRGRSGWAWLRPFRDYEEYEDAVRDVFDELHRLDKEPRGFESAEEELVGGKS